MKIRRLPILLLVAVLLIAGGWAVYLGVRGERQWELSRAALEGDFATVERCIKAGVDIDATPMSADGANTGFPAITAAAFSGHADIVRYLLANGANPNRKGMSNPLIVACWRQHPAVAELLLEHSADPNARGEGTPSIAAEATGQSELLSLLRHHGADE